MSSREIDQPSERDDLPLSGIRVLDLGRYIAAPLCAALLADEGAEVIRIEPPEGAADREVMPIGIEGRGGLYLQMNRNKKSLTLDIGSERGRSILNQLITISDVVVVNLPFKALKAQGLDYDALRKIKENIILTTISAFSYSGIDRDRVGFDGTGQALSGAMHLTGTGEKPMRSAASYVDYATGMFAAFSTTSALFKRYRSGIGQHVQVSLMGTALAMMNPMLMEEATGSRRRSAMTNRSPIAGPSDLFKVKDGWVMVQVIGNAMFARWCELIGCKELLDDPRFQTDTDRGENGKELSALMADWCKDMKTDECLSELEKYRIPGCPTLTPSDTLKMQGIEDYLDYIPLKDSGHNIPIVTECNSRFFKGSRPEHGVAPLLGSNTKEVLEMLGFTQEEFSALKKDRVV